MLRCQNSVADYTKALLHKQGSGSLNQHVGAEFIRKRGVGQGIRL
jgi:hypothetical protein